MLEITEFARRCKKCNKIMKRTERPKGEIEYYCSYCAERENEIQRKL